MGEAKTCLPVPSQTRSCPSAIDRDVPGLTPSERAVLCGDATPECLRKFRPCPSGPSVEACRGEPCKHFWAPIFQHTMGGCVNDNCRKCHDAEHIPSRAWVQLHVRRSRT